MLNITSFALKSPPRIAAVLDGDNLFRRWNGSQIRPDTAAMATALTARGAQSATIVRNFFAPNELLRWQRAGFVTKAVNRNCDGDAMLIAIEYVMRGLDTLILATGDADFLPLVEATHHAGTAVEVWTKKDNASKKLIRSADSVRFLDQLIEPSVGFAAKAA